MPNNCVPQGAGQLGGPREWRSDVSKKCAAPFRSHPKDVSTGRKFILKLTSERFENDRSELAQVCSLRCSHLLSRSGDVVRIGRGNDNEVCGL